MLNEYMRQHAILPQRLALDVGVSYDTLHNHMIRPMVLAPKTIAKYVAATGIARERIMQAMYDGVEHSMCADNVARDGTVGYVRARPGTDSGAQVGAGAGGAQAVAGAGGAQAGAGDGGTQAGAGDGGAPMDVAAFARTVASAVANSVAREVARQMHASFDEMMKRIERGAEEMRRETRRAEIDRAARRPPRRQHR
jgi:hypothetical protein